MKLFPLAHAKSSSNSDGRASIVPRGPRLLKCRANKKIMPKALRVNED